MITHSLSVRGLTKSYGATTALRPTDLDIGAGEFFTLLGPSGSGKTTLLMLIAGFATPSGGEILLDGQAITQQPPEQRNFGMVFQGYALFPHMTVAENVAFPLSIRRKSKAEIAERVKAALDLVQLGGLAERLPKMLSGGQQQRVALARALVFEPALLLLDEPLSALDRKLRKQLQSELKALHLRLGTTFIYVTHDQDEALSLSDRVSILRDGRILQVGPPLQLYDRPATEFVAQFLGETNFLRGRVTGRDGDTTLVAAGGVTLRHAGTLPEGPALLGLRPEKIAVGVPGAGENGVAGTLAGLSFYGSYLQLEVETPDCGRLLVHLPDAAAQGAFRLGGTVPLRWPADATRALAQEP